jgi:hypothetical protein
MFLTVASRFSGHGRVQRSVSFRIRSSFKALLQIFGCQRIDTIFHCWNWMLDASASRESAINPEKNAFPQVIGGLGSLGEGRKDGGTHF